MKNQLKTIGKSLVSHVIPIKIAFFLNLPQLETNPSA